MTHEDRIARLERRIAELEAIVGTPAHRSGVSGPHGYEPGTHMGVSPYAAHFGTHAQCFVFPDGSFESGCTTCIPAAAPETFRP